MPSRFGHFFKDKRAVNGNGASKPTNASPQYRVCIVVPCQDDVKAMFAYDLAVMAAASEGNPNIDLSMYFHRGTLIADQREALADHCVRDGVTHILWLDSDMRFPPWTLARLLAHNLPIVGANYTSRRSPIKFIALKRLSETERIEVVTDETSPDLEEVEFTGMGVMMTEARIFTEDSKPWFFVEYIESKRFFNGEDVWFCKTARDRGYKTYVDHVLSRSVRHVGEREYGLMDVSPDRIARIKEYMNAPAPIELVRV